MERKGTIREYFGLKKPSFMLSPSVDYDCYAGRQEEQENLLERIEDALDIESAPRLVLWGVYGGGKTHTQHYLGKKVLKELAVDSIYVECPDLQKKSTFLDYYNEIMKTIGSNRVKKLIHQYLVTKTDVGFRQLLASEDMANVCSKFVISSGEDEIRAWRWIVGEQVSATDAIGLGATSALDSRTATRFLINLGRLNERVDNKKLVILADEMEKLGNVTDADALRTFETAFREISEKLQTSLGLIFACYASDYERVPGPLAVDAVSSRIGSGNYIQISQLRDDQLEPFIKDLIQYVVNEKIAVKKTEELTKKGLTIDKGLYPFTKEAIGQLIAYIMEDPRRRTPRIIADVMNDAATEAKRLCEGLVSVDAVKKAIQKRERAPRPTFARPRRRSRVRRS